MRNPRFLGLIGAGGGLWLLGSCDPTIQTTVENGLINASTALLTSTIRGLIQAISEAGDTAMILQGAANALSATLG